MISPSEAAACFSSMPQCGARRLHGGICRHVAQPGRRCHLHGGASTGPRDKTYHLSIKGRDLNPKGWIKGKPRSKRGQINWLVEKALTMLPVVPPMAAIEANLEGKT